MVVCRVGSAPRRRRASGSRTTDGGRCTTQSVPGSLVGLDPVGAWARPI